MTQLIQRRSFLSKLSAATLAGGGAAATVTAEAATAPQPTKPPPATTPPPGEAAAEPAIRHLHHTFITAFNAGDRTHFAPEHATCLLTHPQYPDAITLAPDAQSATARFHALVKLQRPIESNLPLVEMARQQGGALLSTWQSGTFENSYRKQNGAWKLAELTYRPSPDPVEL